jgi:hypothetical protein
MKRSMMEVAANMQNEARAGRELEVEIAKATTSVSDVTLIEVAA